jgi:ABC-2 type transport system ATP-binding protein
MIMCRGLVKSYRGIRAVDSVTLEIRPGICALLGANGAGKSTLLKLLTGLVSPDIGEIRIAGVDIASRSTDSTEVRKLIGVLPEDLGLFDDLSIYEHLNLTGPIYGLSMQETDRRAEILLRLLALDHAPRTPLRECSFGMRKKTALAMALLHDPQVLFLDEPFEGIDPSASKVIASTLSTLAGRGKTILLTSHILPLVESLASRTLILHQGSVAWDFTGSTPAGSLAKVYFGIVGEPHVEALPWQ